LFQAGGLRLAAAIASEERACPQHQDSDTLYTKGMLDKRAWCRRIVLAWNTRRMDAAMTRLEADVAVIGRDWLRRMGGARIPSWFATQALRLLAALVLMACNHEGKGPLNSDPSHPPSAAASANAGAPSAAANHAGTPGPRPGSPAPGTPSDEELDRRERELTKPRPPPGPPLPKPPDANDSGISDPARRPPGPPPTNPKRP
jgi:hypothetical protein